MQALLAQNPALLSNPLLALTVLANPALLGQPSQSPMDQPIIAMKDPDVQDLCDHFNIEDRHGKRLNEILKTRQETFAEDLDRLYDVLERARDANGLLVVKMREMEDGTFRGRAKADKELAAISKKYGLDNQAESKLADILSRYDETKRKDYFVEIERHLEVSNRPSAMAMMLLKKLGEGQPLGRPGPPAPGSYLDRLQQERSSRGRGDRDRGRDTDRERGRSRERDRRERDRKSRSRRR